jgi:hypothetical protein
MTLFVGALNAVGHVGRRTPVREAGLVLRCRSRLRSFGVAREHLGLVAELLALLGRLPRPLARLGCLNPHDGAFRKMPAQGGNQVGSARRAKVAPSQQEVRANPVEGQRFGAPRADRNRMIVAVR